MMFRKIGVQKNPKLAKSTSVFADRGWRLSKNVQNDVDVKYGAFLWDLMNPFLLSPLDA